MRLYVQHNIQRLVGNSKPKNIQSGTWVPRARTPAKMASQPDTPKLECSPLLGANWHTPYRDYRRRSIHLISSGTLNSYLSLPNATLIAEHLCRRTREKIASDAVSSARCDISRAGWSSANVALFTETTCSSSLIAFASSSCPFFWYAIARLCWDANKSGWFSANIAYKCCSVGMEASTTRGSGIRN